MPHRIGVDLEDPSRSTDTQALSQAGHDPHDAFDLGVFAVEDGAVGLQKIALARGAVALTPGATPGMTVGPEIAKPQPASV